MSKRELNILVVDDEAYIRRSLRGYLEDAGYSVVEAADGGQAVDIFGRGGVSLVLLDLRMPKMDGLQTLAQIRTLAPETPVIVISGAGTMDDVVQALRLGAWDYLAKPIADLAILGHTVQRAVERLSLLRERREYQQNLEEEVARRTAELRQANAAKDEFLAKLSHELRTPLTPTLLALGMMKVDKTLSDDHRLDVEMACRNIELEARLIDDLLDLTRIMSGKLELKTSDCDAHEVVRAAMQIRRTALQDKRLSLEVALDAPAHRLRGDEARLQQVIWNLLGNAVKFTPPGGKVTIRTHNHSIAGADQLVLEVGDTGIGMSPETLGRLFRPFEQADREITRKYGGLGIGLAICKAIVELHSGTIEAASDGLGRGSIFRMRLPLTTASSCAGGAL